MNTPLRNILFSCVALVTVSTYGASGSAINVTVKDKASGKTVYQGTTDTDGSFKTGSLQPGAYTLELRPDAKDVKANQMTIALGGIKGQPEQSAIAGGLAVNVKVAPASRISGKVTTTQAVLKAGKDTELVKANVKIINGKRHVWVQGGLGSNVGGKWVEEGTDGAKIRTGSGGDREALSRMQDIGAQGAATGR